MKHDIQPIEWDSTFSVGVPEMDDQHKRILELVNQLVQSEDLGVHSETVHGVLDRLTRYAEEHFAAEEAFLRECGFPDLACQEKSHQFFVKRVAFFCIDITSLKPRVPDDLLAFLRSWWVDHILKEDMAYRFFLESQGKD